MENYINKDTIEQKSALLDRLIKVAKNNAVSDSEYNREDDIKGIYEHAKIHVKTLPEFKMVLEKIGMPYDNLIDTLEHENAHANKAEELGALHEKYAILCIKYKDGYGYIPQAGIYIPDEWTNEKQMHVKNKIISAPEEYGNYLSQDDLEDLK